MYDADDDEKAVELIENAMEVLKEFMQIRK